MPLCPLFLLCTWKYWVNFIRIKYIIHNTLIRFGIRRLPERIDRCPFQVEWNVMELAVRQFTEGHFGLAWFQEFDDGRDTVWWQQHPTHFPERSEQVAQFRDGSLSFKILDQNHRFGTFFRRLNSKSISLSHSVQSEITDLAESF